jgi:DNA replication protein DnaC
MLLGGVGSGKTVAAAWAVASYARRSMGAKYDKMRDVANLYRAGFGDDLKAFERMLRVPLLVIDELTTERDADLGKAALHEVVDERASRDLRTLLLANRTKDEIRDRYDARTIDRLRECAAVVTLADKSMRKGAW